MPSIKRGFKVTANGKIKCLAAALSVCSFCCFLNRSSCISSAAQLSRNGEILFTLNEASWPKVGRLAAQPRKEPGREPVAFQHCLFVATCCAQSAEPERCRLTQLSPEPVHGGGPHACGGLLPSGTHCRCAGGLSWETQGNVLPRS